MGPCLAALRAVVSERLSYPVRRAHVGKLTLPYMNLSPVYRNGAALQFLQQVLRLCRHQPLTRHFLGRFNCPNPTVGRTAQRETPGGYCEHHVTERAAGRTTR